MDQHAALQGGGTGGEARKEREGGIIPGKVTGGRSMARGGASAVSLDGRISWTIFPEEKEGDGRTGSRPSGSDFLASAILQQSLQGFSPLKVSLAPWSNPSSWE